jgi:hypothetical protein
MSAFQTPLEHQVLGPAGPGAPKLAFKASVYFFLVAAAAAVAAAAPLSQLKTNTPGWTTFAILAAIAATAQLFVVSAPRHYAYHTTIVFLIPAAMLLPPGLVVLIGVIHHIPEWLKTRVAWYIQSFNIFNWTLAMLGAWASFHAVMSISSSSRVSYALAGVAAAASMVAINHVLMAPMLRLARGLSMRDSGLFSFQSLSTDLVLAMLGVATAAFWRVNPWLIVFAIAPLFLIHRSLSVPQLQEEARVDPKTGLFNARHFAIALNEELTRAARFERPLSLVMADLDLLRDINNTYGHLGRRRAAGIAEVFRSHLRHYDVPGALRRRGVRDPVARDASGAGLRDRRADPTHGCGKHFRRGDLERAHPCNRLDRRRGLPARRRRHERADPPGRPRRLPGEAPGPEPRPRCELGPARAARAAAGATRRGPGERRPRLAAAARRRGAAGA